MICLRNWTIADSVLANHIATDADKTYAMAIKEAAL